MTRPAASGFLFALILTACATAPSAFGPEGAQAMPDFETTCAMRDEAGCTADWGTAGTQLKMRVFTNDSRKLDDMFARDEGAVMCQGAAYYLHLKYLEAGYRSYLVGFQSDLFSHAMTLVEVRRADGTTALIVQDPSFNLSYVDADGQPLSVFEIMTLLAEGRHDAITVKQGRPAEVDFLRHPDDPDPSGSIYVTGLRGPSPGHPGWSVYNATISIDAFEAALSEKVRAFCEQKGVSESLLYAIFDEPIYVYRRYPMTPGDQADADATFERLRKQYRLSQNLDAR